MEKKYIHIHIYSDLSNLGLNLIPRSFFFIIFSMNPQSAFLLSWIIHMITRIFLNNINFPKTSWPRFSNYDKARIWITMIPHLWISTKPMQDLHEADENLRNPTVKDEEIKKPSWVMSSFPSFRMNPQKSGADISGKLGPIFQVFGAKQNTVCIWRPYRCFLGTTSLKKAWNYVETSWNFVNPSQTCLKKLHGPPL